MTGPKGRYTIFAITQNRAERSARPDAKVMTMTPASILGLAGTLVGLVRALPQLISLLKSREAFGVSVDTAATSSVVSFGWAVYGMLTGQPYVTLATGASGLVFFLIAAAAVRFGRSFKEIQVTPVWFAVLGAALAAKGAEGLGWVLPVSVLVANLPQLVLAFREADLKDLSLGTWLLSMTDGLVWGAYALIAQDLSILVFGGLQLSTSALIVFLKRLKQKRQLPAG